MLLDTAQQNRVIKISSVNAWNVQQGCMAQWLGPDFRTRIIFNDFRDGRYCSVIFNIRDMKIEKILPKPIYDVAVDGSYALSLDFSRLHRLRPGYGYSNLPDSTRDNPCPDKTCIWKLDLKTSSVTDLLKYRDLADFQPDITMKGAVHKVNHLMIRPDGKRFYVTAPFGSITVKKHTRLVTADQNGKNLYKPSAMMFSFHYCFWKTTKKLTSHFLRKCTEQEIITTL